MSAAKLRHIGQRGHCGWGVDAQEGCVGEGACDAAGDGHVGQEHEFFDEPV